MHRISGINSMQITISIAYIWICKFEMNDGASTLNRMEQQTNDAFDWSLHKGTTPSDETGPDRAYNGDFYIFIEASRPRRQGDRARFVIQCHILSYYCNVVSFNENLQYITTQ